jgi:CheY-like chemotaxis protein
MSRCSAMCFIQGKLLISKGLMGRRQADRLLLFLVEDSPADVYLVQEAIRREGLQVHLEIADDGERAIRMIEEVDSNASAPCPDLLLLDLNVPRQTGDEVLARIRQSQRLAHIPVVIMTSSESAADRERLMKLGATAYFRKPPNLREFMKLGRLLRELHERARHIRPAL